MTDLAGLLAEGLAELHLKLPAEVRPRLLDYLALMQKWNIKSFFATRRSFKNLWRMLLPKCFFILLMRLFP